MEGHLDVEMVVLFVKVLTGLSVLSWVTNQSSTDQFRLHTDNSASV